MMPRALCFDLLTALLDSWSLWNRCAGAADVGLRWRTEYLRLTYGAGGYVPYETLVLASAAATGVPERAATQLLAEWDTLTPWPDVAFTLARLPAALRLAVVTNCSTALGRRAVALVEAAAGRRVDVVVTAEAVGAYKPDPRPYRAALAALDCAPDEVLFVAGSPNDLGGATGVGMPVAWHNAIALTRPATQPAPIAEGATLAATLHGAGIGDGLALERATAADRDHLVAFSRATFTAAYAHNHHPDQLAAYCDRALTAPRWEATLADAATWTGLVRAPDGTAAAYTVWRPAAPPTGVALPGVRAPYELSRLYVAEPWQRRGIGAALVQSLVGRTRAAGGDALWLAVAQDNPEAIAFYETLGFRPVGETTFDFAGTIEPDFVMARRW